MAEKRIDPLPGNLLVGAKVETSGIPHTDRLVDGLVAPEGDFWDTPTTARFDKPEAHVVWDLGADKPLSCFLIQGDNNDSYIFEGSPDGKEWKALWTAGPATGAGVRLRQTKLPGPIPSRFVRLSATGGDRLYSAAEVAVYQDCPAGWPKLDLPVADAQTGGSAAQANGVWTVALGLFAVALVAFVLLTRRRTQPPQVPVEPPPPDNEPLG